MRVLLILCQLPAVPSSVSCWTRRGRSGHLVILRMEPLATMMMESSCRRQTKLSSDASIAPCRLKCGWRRTPRTRPSPPSLSHTLPRFLVGQTIVAITNENKVYSWGFGGY